VQFEERDFQVTLQLTTCVSRVDLAKPATLYKAGKKVSLLPLQ